MDDNTSPKRSAVVEVNKKDRKKCKPTNHSFLNNCDFSAVNTLNKNDKNHQVNGKSMGKIPALALDSFSELARSYGEVDHNWNTSTTTSYSSDWNENKEDVHGNLYAVDFFSLASYSFHDEAMDGTESVLSSSMSMASSTRKRGVCRSQFLIVESPVV